MKRLGQTLNAERATWNLSGESPDTTGESPVLPTEERVFTKPELAKHLKVSIRTITEMMKRGELAYIKINGRLVRFRLEDVHARLTETCLVCNAPEGGAEGKAEILKAETLKAGPLDNRTTGLRDNRKGAPLR